MRAFSCAPTVDGWIKNRHPRQASASPPLARHGSITSQAKQFQPRGRFPSTKPRNKSQITTPRHPPPKSASVGKRKQGSRDGLLDDDESHPAKRHTPPQNDTGSDAVIKQAPFLQQSQQAAAGKKATSSSSPYADVFASVLAAAEKEEEVARRRCVPVPFWQQARMWTDPGYLAGQANAGDAREAAVRRTLDEFHDPASGRLLERSDTQRTFHTHMLNASAKSIYGRDFAVSASRILERNQWTEFRQEVCIITARGEGKTWSVAMYAASLMINQPMVSVVIFSVAKRQTIQMITLIKQMLASHPVGREMLKGRPGAEHLDLQGAGGPNDRRTVTGLPGRSDTTRGIHAQYVLIDEAAFLSYMLFMETILPTLTKGHTCLIAISTPQGEDNVYTWLTQLTDSSKEGRPLFNVVRTSRVCDACIEAKKAMTCTHLRSKLPPWQEMSKVARMAQLYENDPHLHMREIMGVSADAGSKAFLKDDVTAFFASKVRIDNREDVRAVYISADPSGGGSSELAVVAMVEDTNGKLAVRVWCFFPPPCRLYFAFFKNFYERTPKNQYTDCPTDDQPVTCMTSPRWPLMGRASRSIRDMPFICSLSRSWSG